MVPLCLFRLRPISAHLTRNFHQDRECPKKSISLQVPEVQEALRFWADLRDVSWGVPLGFDAPNQTLITDAPESGWGAVLGPYQHSGLWT